MQDSIFKARLRYIFKNLSYKKAAERICKVSTNLQGLLTCRYQRIASCFSIPEKYVCLRETIDQHAEPSVSHRRQSETKRLWGTKRGEADVSFGPSFLTDHFFKLHFWHNVVIFQWLSV